MTRTLTILSLLTTGACTHTPVTVAPFDSGEPIPVDTQDSDTGEPVDTQDSDTSVEDTGCEIVDDCEDCFRPVAFQVNASFGYNQETDSAETMYVPDASTPTLILQMASAAYLDPESEGYLKYSEVCSITIVPATTSFPADPSWPTALDWGFTFTLSPDDYVWQFVNDNCGALNPEVWGTDLAVTFAAAPRISVGVGAVLDPAIASRMATYGIDTSIYLGGGYSFDGAYYPGAALGVVTDGDLHVNETVFIEPSALDEQVPTGAYGVKGTTSLIAGSVEDMASWAPACRLLGL